MGNINVKRKYYFIPQQQMKLLEYDLIYFYVEQYIKVTKNHIVLHGRIKL